MDERALFAFTVDAVLIHGDHVAMIRRGKEPFKGSLAFIGGHVELDETALYAAQRELHEEVGVLLGPDCFTEVPGIWDAVNRNPLRRTIGVAYLVRVPMGCPRPALVAGDDATAAEWVRIIDVLVGRIAVAFDHRQMLNAVVRFTDGER
jgi:8-oxo-dGTP diphosphatase